MGRVAGRRLLARALAALAIPMLLLSIAGCAGSPPAGVTHIVRPGENLYRISRYYGVPVPDIVDANRVRDVTNLRVGQRLFVPGASRPPPREPLRPGVGPGAPAFELAARARREADLEFAWPLRGRLSSRFGGRRGRPHEGIDIAARPGTPIRAAEAGRVIHSGRGLGAYGKVVIVKHAGPYSSVYAHNRRNRVRVGEFVERGQVIAEVGQTGNASGPHVHFEIRRERRALDPLAFLP